MAVKRKATIRVSTTPSARPAQSTASRIWSRNPPAAAAARSTWSENQARVRCPRVGEAPRTARIRVSR